MADAPPSAASPSPSAPRPLIPALPGLPAVLAGRYRVLAPLGRGALAEVVRARDEVSGGEVALKILHPSLRRQEAVADRFRREAQIASRIDHPHVLRMLGVDEEAGFLFLVMPLHGGGDLADLVARRGPLPLAEVLLVGRQLAGALAAAHRAGVIHRDVKPQNVLVGTDADVGRPDVRLADFGLARTADLAGLTTRATVLGTPEYMAPEVIAHGHADPRSDVYALGALLFEAATGRPPFVADAPFQVLRAQLEVEPPRATALRPDLPAWLDEVLLRALSKDPLDRFPSALALEAALGEPAPGEAALGELAPAVAAPGARAEVGPRCARCGGVVLESAGLCLDCGAHRLRLRVARGGVGVLVTGPGQVADKLDGRSHAGLVRLLGELPPGQARFGRLFKRSPRLPFWVVRDVDERSADELVQRLRQLGLEARVESGGALAPIEMGQKVRRMGGRLLAVVGAATAGVWSNAVRHPATLLASVALFTTLPFAAAALTYRRPVARLARRAGIGGQDRLLASLGRLGRREERRLVGRIAARLEALRTSGNPAGQALAGRAADVAEALARLDESDGSGGELGLVRRLGVADADGRGEVVRALDAARERERSRALLQADLLRVWGRLERVAAAEAHGGAQAAGVLDAGASDRLADLRLELEAEEEVAALLGRFLPPAPQGRGR